MQVGGDKRKRVAGAIKEEEDFEEEGEEDGKQPAKKRSSVKAGWIDPSPILKAGCCAMLLMCLLTGCKCKSGCKTKACSCRKAGPYCTSLCGCPANKCAHRFVKLMFITCSTSIFSTSFCFKSRFCFIITQSSIIVDSGRTQGRTSAWTPRWTRTRRTSWTKKTAGSFKDTEIRVHHSY